MLTEDQIILKLKELKQIKPDSDWVYLTKLDVFGAERPAFSFGFVFSHKMAFSALTVFIAIIGVFGFALSSVPGDSLFQLKKITEYGQSYFVSSANQPKYNLELANKRLDDLAIIAGENKIEKLAVGIEEYNESKTNVVKSLINSGDSATIEELSNGLQGLKTKENPIKSLGIELGQGKKLNSDEVEKCKKFVEKEILEMEDRGLTEEDLKILESVEFEYEQGNYQEALIILLEARQTQ
ncbi:hypothetical protein KKA24_02765 [Patescibacteria group bacterium]|nr:hypothetical protein [Patescibacteria group bacterium]